jgi:hypothetical protein
MKVTQIAVDVGVSQPARPLKSPPAFFALPALFRLRPPNLFPRPPVRRRRSPTTLLSSSAGEPRN